MRVIRLVAVPALVLSALTGCDIAADFDFGEWETTGGDWMNLDQPPTMEDGFLAHRSGMSGFDVDGMHIPEGQDWAVLGMSGMTCQIYMSTASFGTDVDMTTGDDTIEDGATDDEGNEVVVISNGDELQVTKMPTAEVVTQMYVPGHVASERTFDGWISLADFGGCGLEWYTIDGDKFADAELEDSYCEVGETTDSFDVDMANDVAWVAGDLGTAIVTTFETIEAEVPADIVAWDPVTGLAYTTVTGTTFVTAIDPQGQVRWTADVSLPIFGLDDMNGDAVVTVAREDGYTDVVVIDGDTGGILTSQSVAREPGAVIVSEDGSSLGLASEGQFDFFDVGTLETE